MKILLRRRTNELSKNNLDSFWTASDRTLKMALMGLSLMFGLQGCLPGNQRLMQQAEKLEADGDHEKALDTYEKITARYEGDPVALEAVRAAEKISFYELKNFTKSAELLKYIIVNSPDSREREATQKQIADLYFTQLNDYPKAVMEINRLLMLNLTGDETAEYKLKLAKAYFHQNNFSQAENEVDEFLRQNSEDKNRFDFLLLKANIFLGRKDLADAAQVYASILEKYPEKAEKANVPLTLATCYEEMKDYKNARATLELLKKTHLSPEYIDQKIKKLALREQNAPRTKGTKK